MPRKTCSKCAEAKLLREFAADKRHKDGLQSHCRDCKTEYDKQYYPKQKEQIKRASRKSKLKRLYGMVEEDYQNLLVGQKGVCAICGQPELRMLYGKESRLGVDHSHETGIVRGLLCSNCNQILGNAKDNPDRLRRAALYLEGV